MRTLAGWMDQRIPELSMEWHGIGLLFVYPTYYTIGSTKASILAICKRQKDRKSKRDPRDLRTYIHTTYEGSSHCRYGYMVFKTLLMALDALKGLFGYLLTLH